MLQWVGLRKTSLLDYPGKVCAVIFLPGCNLRCPWCQNRELAVPELSGAPFSPGNAVPLEEALALIERRKKLLGGVVLSGGEPTVHASLGDLIGRLHEIGHSVKLDTNGMNPGALGKICGDPFSRPDYIALDLKLAPGRYGELLPASDPGGIAFDPAAALAESAALIHSSLVPREYRSLALPGGYFGGGDIEALAPLVRGGSWYFRPFVPGNCLDPAWNSLPSAGEKETAALAERARALGKEGLAPPGGGIVQKYGGRYNSKSIFCTSR
jgi:pyruvate formate lyase activating enzyme